MAADRVVSLTWSAAATSPGAIADPAGLASADLEWLPAAVPGTAAGALRAAGRSIDPDDRDLDAEDWWFRADVTVAPDAPGHVFVLRLGGVATVSEVWLDGVMVLSGTNMFARSEVEVGSLAGDHQLVVCCRALRPLLDGNHPRPRWKTRLVPDQSLRWYRTTFLGRTPGFGPVPAPVGPWRGIDLVPAAPRLIERHLEVSVVGSDGLVRVRALVAALSSDKARLRVGDSIGDASVAPQGDGTCLVEAEVRIADVALWWPHTHGPQPLYDVRLELASESFSLGRVGFRTIEIDQTGGAFAPSVNGVAVFCRGVCWVPLDPVELADDPAALRSALEAVREAGMNMVRLTGTMVYEDAAFWDLCDELGILVWHDAMFANVDPPDDEAFLTSVEAELASVLAPLQGRPSLAVVCGGSEIEQQAAMMGRDPSQPIVLLDRVIPTAVGRLLPGVHYVRSSPTGGDLPFHVDQGVGHYYGVGAYLRPLEDARRAAVRFTTECLAFAIPPECPTVAASFPAVGDIGGARWRRAVPRDRDADWDFQDVTDHYVALLFGADAAALRAADPERALDLARATVAHLVESTLSEWRHPGSSCHGALIFTGRDLVPGAGWGLTDSVGRPKAPWFAARRVLQPVALLVTDEGLNGLHLHAVNDGAAAFDGELVVETYAADGRVLDRGDVTISVAPRSATTVGAEAVLGAFRDVTYAYRFGPAQIDAVSVTLSTAAGVVSEALYLPGGQRRAQEDLGMTATASRSRDGWCIEVTARRLAQWVAIDVDGRPLSDSWFHLAPGSSRRVGVAGDAPPIGTVRALNGVEPAAIAVRS